MTAGRREPRKAERRPASPLAKQASWLARERRADDDTAQGPQSSSASRQATGSLTQNQKKHPTILSWVWPSVSERSTPRTGNPISKRESPPYTPQAGRKRQSSAMCETSVGTVARNQRAVWEQHGVKRNRAVSDYKQICRFLGWLFPFAAGVTRRSAAILGGRPLAQPVGALPFFGWSPASSRPTCS